MFDTAETSDQDPEQDIEMIATLNCVRRVLINQLVSKKKRRYKADGYNLDLSYVNHFPRTNMDRHQKILCMADKTKANDERKEEIKKKLLEELAPDLVEGTEGMEATGTPEAAEATPTDPKKARKQPSDWGANQMLS